MQGNGPAPVAQQICDLGQIFERDHADGRIQQGLEDPSGDPITEAGVWLARRRVLPRPRQLATTLHTPGGVHQEISLPQHIGAHCATCAPVTPDVWATRYLKQYRLLLDDEGVIAAVEEVVHGNNDVTPYVHITSWTRSGGMALCDSTAARPWRMSIMSIN